MPKFNINIPPLVRSRSNEDTHPFQRLRSFYLTPSPTKAQFDIVSLTPTPGASTNPSPTSSHFPISGAQKPPGSTVADNSSERTLRAVRSMDSVSQEKYHYGKVDVESPARAKQEGTASRKTFLGFRRPRRRNRGTIIMLCLVLVSLFLVVCLCLAFIGAGAGEGQFKKALDAVATEDPGVSRAFPT
ncbi:hypothetical protein NMY22_g8173 [Coprinellus aureogranulatus]|nr:hypothetical protein NMY22_g8173 [Coprinellus aureogranulatus]